MKNLIIAVSFLISINCIASIKLPSVELSKVVYIQKGVTSFEGVSGLYVYYRLPSDENFNVEKHRKFISNSDYFKLINNKLQKSYDNTIRQ